MENFVHNTISEDVKFLTEQLQAVTKAIDKKLDVLLEPFVKYSETRDIRFLRFGNEADNKENIQVSKCHKIKTHLKKSPLAEIVENVPFQMVVKLEKISSNILKHIPEDAKVTSNIMGKIKTEPVVRKTSFKSSSKSSANDKIVDQEKVNSKDLLTFNTLFPTMNSTMNSKIVDGVAPVENISLDPKPIETKRRTSTRNSCELKGKPLPQPLFKFSPKPHRTLKVNKPAVSTSIDLRPGGAEKAKPESKTEASRKRKQLLLTAHLEEKELKVMKQRKYLEKEQRKFLEIQTLKEKKRKHVLAQKVEKLRTQKEESKGKKVCAKQSVGQVKEKEDIRLGKESALVNNYNTFEKCLLDQNMMRTQQQNTKTRPVYMITNPPLLPTRDCYDSDDSRHYENKRMVYPDWCNDGRLTNMQKAMLVVGEALKNSFFCRKTHSPDLRDIFECIDAEMLKRTSSALWKKPPRYTRFSATSGIHFGNPECI